MLEFSFMLFSPACYILSSLSWSPPPCSDPSLWVTKGVWAVWGDSWMSPVVVQSWRGHCASSCPAFGGLKAWTRDTLNPGKALRLLSRCQPSRKETPPCSVSQWLWVWQEAHQSPGDSVAWAAVAKECHLQEGKLGWVCCSHHKCNPSSPVLPKTLAAALKVAPLIWPDRLWDEGGLPVCCPAPWHQGCVSKEVTGTTVCPAVHLGDNCWLECGWGWAQTAPV